MQEKKEKRNPNNKVVMDGLLPSVSNSWRSKI